MGGSPSLPAGQPGQVGAWEVGQLTIGVHVVTWHLGWREALLEGVATAIRALLHGHDLLLWRRQRRVRGHHAFHSARQHLWGHSMLSAPVTPQLTGLPKGCPNFEAA